MATGGGHAPFVETMSGLGIPAMSKISFIATEKEIAGKWWASLEEKIRDAAEEEKKLIPSITVIVDGGVV